MPDLLYRGVNPEMHAITKGELRPKHNDPFVAAPAWNESEWGNVYWGENAANAVIVHQRGQLGLPTSGVSTTPLRDRAIYYATHNGKFKQAYLYVIDRDLLSGHGVSAYDVNAIVPQPSIPEDSEVILVAKDFGSLPREIVVEIIAIDA